MIVYTCEGSMLSEAPLPVKTVPRRDALTPPPEFGYNGET
jgi:hypothetical protein